MLLLSNIGFRLCSCLCFECLLNQSGLLPLEPFSPPFCYSSIHQSLVHDAKPLTRLVLSCLHPCWFRTLSHQSHTRCLMTCRCLCPNNSVSFSHRSHQRFQDSFVLVRSRLLLRRTVSGTPFWCPWHFTTNVFCASSIALSLCSYSTFNAYLHIGVVIMGYRAVVGCSMTWAQNRQPALAMPRIHDSAPFDLQH